MYTLKLCFFYKKIPKNGLFFQSQKVCFKGARMWLDSNQFQKIYI